MRCCSRSSRSARRRARHFPSRHIFQRRRMSKHSTLSVKTRKTSNGAAGRLFVLDLAGGRVLSANPDGSDLKTIVVEGRRLPDGLAVDIAAGHLYWTNMG